MTIHKEKVVLFMPAYFAENTLANVYQKIPKQYLDEIILIDDASKDNIENVARHYGIKFYKNSHNLGYGGNIKECLQKSLEHGADIIIELHPDDQYDPSVIPVALQKVHEGYDFVMGSRFLDSGAALANKMPLWKYSINRMSTYLAAVILGIKLTEFHCGFRVYHRRFIEKINYHENNNGYLFSFEIIAQAAVADVKIAEVPVVCKYFRGATQISMKNTIIYGWGAFKTLLFFMFAKLGIGKKHPIFTTNLSVAPCSQTK